MGCIGVFLFYIEVFGYLPKDAHVLISWFHTKINICPLLRYLWPTILTKITPPCHAHHSFTPQQKIALSAQLFKY